MPRKVLKEEYEGQLEPDEAESNTHVIEDDDDDLDYDLGKEYIRESAASPSVPNAESDGKGENRTKDKKDNADSVNATQGQDAGRSWLLHGGSEHVSLACTLLFFRFSLRSRLS